MTSIVLNPTCDFTNNKADNIIVSYLVPAKLILSINNQWQSFLDDLKTEMKEGKENLSHKKYDSVENIIGRLVDNDEPRRYFFLGSLSSVDLPELFADFQQVASFPIEAAKTLAKPIAKINSPWREQLSTHFSGYMMRIGVDRYAGEARAKLLDTLLEPIKVPQN